MNKKRNFKLVLLGDSGVGKSSFVCALTNVRTARNEKLSKQGPVQLPPEMFQNQECTTILFDTDCGVGELPQEVKQADVILLMYDIQNHNSAERLKGFWLKELDRQNFQQPIIIVGNKLDIVDTQTEFDDEEQELSRIFKVMKPLVKEYQRVEMGIECSTYNFKGIYDVVNCAQRSFIYPLAPIYSIANKQLTTSFKKALTRIFRLCDRDRDGYWSDSELKRFQKKVFKRQLDQNDIAGIKDMIEEELKNSTNREHISLQGFMALQKRGIELMKIQICWTILRFFRYQDDLSLDEGLFGNEILIDRKCGQTVELSEFTISFLRSIFMLENKKLLDSSDLEQIFYPVMEHSHFPQIEQCMPNQQNGIDLIQWISLWNAHAYFNYKESYKLLQYIGCDGKLSDCFRECNRKDSWSSVQRNIERRVFHIALIVVIKQNQLNNSKSPIIITNNNKTYIVSLNDLSEAEVLCSKLGMVDHLVIDERVKFQSEELIPYTVMNLNNVNILDLVKSIANTIHIQPFGYSDYQIKVLKKQNGFPLFQISLLSFSVLFGLMGYFVLRRKFK